MKLAVIAVTNNGARLAERLGQNLPMAADIYAKAGRNPGRAGFTYESLDHLVRNLFSRYDGLVFIMAAGIAVRVLAPVIRDKRFDPAVVVMDEAGENAISLLSGHIGGANDLARLVARAVNARPVITTATDVAGKPAADVLAMKLDSVIEPFEQLKSINAAIVNGATVLFFLDRTLANQARYVQLADELGIEWADIGRLSSSGPYDAAVLVTDKDFSTAKPHIFLRPATLAVGIGCRRGATEAEIGSAIGQALKTIGRSPRSIAVIGTTAVKQDEAGLLALARQWEKPLKFFTNEQLERAIEQYCLATSEFVRKQIGVGNVCEAAALLGGQADSLLLPKTVYRQITVAVAEVKSRWWESDPGAWPT